MACRYDRSIRPQRERKIAANLENPILFVEPRKQDLKQRVIEGFSEPKEIVKVTAAFRKGLVKRIGEASLELQAAFEQYPSIPAVVALRLHPDAMAKTHRPMMLLERVGMRPIGTRRFGELLLPATAASLQHLADIAARNEAKVIKANLSTIDEIVSFGRDDVLGWRGLSKGDASEAEKHLASWIKARKPLLLERFTSTDEATDDKIRSVLSQLYTRLGIVLDQVELPAARGFATFVRVRTIKDALSLASFSGVRALRPAEELAPIEIRPQMFAPIGAAPAGLLPPPAAGLPVVAVVDSGVPANDRSLKPWIAKHVTYVLPPDTDHLHGTFVSGLVAGARILNANDAGFPAAQARVLDVAALSSGSTSESDLLLRIEEAIKDNRDVKVWNCSFGSKQPCELDRFGRFAQDLDALSDRYGVLFVIAAGNYEIPPLRAWPPVTDLHGKDRIGTPAESLRGMTVGSIAHQPALVQPEEPSPFSRRGPGAANTPKPDVTHRGGNCTKFGAFANTGVRSFLPGSRLGESIGTSFSTPLVSALAANVWQTLEKRGIATNPEIVKGLTIHAAALSSPIRKVEERNYHGFGVPNSTIDILFCSPDTFTLMFEAELFDGIIWEKTPFPVPACLRPDSDHLRAEVVMTLVYSPPLDGRHGAEYVRANIDASFGTYDADDDGELHHHGLVPLDAPKREDLYEKAMVDHGFKWSPVKVYHGRFARGKAGRNFRLKLELLRRAGEAAKPDPQKATVILSFRGIEDGQPVYADGLLALRAVNWATNALAMRTHVRL
jgi:hypothetical protein